MPTRASGSSKRYEPITSIGASAGGPHGWVGAQSAMSSSLVGVIVRAMKDRHGSGNDAEHASHEGWTRQ